ncbi:hypothetical protein CRYUN_Cryun38cG0049900 [Craigia yunnanensis]
MGLFRRQASPKSFLMLPKPSSYLQFGSSKVFPSSQLTQNSYPRGFTDQNLGVYLSVQKVSSSSSSSSSNSANFIDRNGYRNPAWGGDENVDEKATSFISYVRERLHGEF